MVEKDICNICDKLVTGSDEGLLCETCFVWKHRACLSISKKTYEKISKSVEKWECDPCKKDKTVPQKPPQNFTIADVMAKLIEMDARLQHIEVKYDLLVEKYQEQIKINEELKQELKQIKHQMNKKEQAELCRNIVIQGIPYAKNENLGDIIKKIGSELNVTISTEHFQAIRLGKEENKNSPIKVMFVEEELKKRVMKSPRKYTLSTQELGFPVNNKVYLNHDLTKRNIQLFKAAQSYRMDKKYKYLWISNGNILMRKDENTKVFLIEKEEDLAKNVV